MNNIFYKYQGTGNDFVIIDNRHNVFNKKNNQLISKLCNRRYGVGADGLILLENDECSDFKMIYFNADGNESTMCGNGGRCIAHFSNYLNIVGEEMTFKAIDGLHRAKIMDNLISLQMCDAKNIQTHGSSLFLDTGSPHQIEICNNVDNININIEGKTLRNSSIYNKSGSNVNFVEKIDSSCFKVRTYERGVENETLSCGTGVTAAAIAMHYLRETKNNNIKIKTKGGVLSVSFNFSEKIYHDIWLTGPANQVFQGNIKW